MKKLGWFLLLLLASRTSLFATTYRVTKTGSGTACTVAAPCLTIALGLGKLAAGDTLEVGDGTYAESFGTNIIPSGTSDNARTIVKAINIRGVTITGAGSFNGLVTQLGIFGKSYITFDGFILDGSAYSSLPALNANNLIGYDASSVISHHVTVQNTTMIGKQFVGCVGTHGYGHSPGSPLGYQVRNHHLSWLNNIIHDCAYGSGVTYIHAVYVWASDMTLDGNTIYRSDGQGIQIYDSNIGNANSLNDDPLDLDRVTISNNYIHDIGVECIRNGFGSTQLNYNNVLSNCAYLQSAAGIWIGDEFVSGSSSYNNTIVGSVGFCIRSNGAPSVIAKNNLCYSNSSNTLNGTFSTQTNNLLTATNQFVDYASRDLHLAAAVAALDAGANLSGTIPAVDKDGNTRPQGTAWDIGAYERINGAPPTDLIPLADFTCTASADIAGCNDGSNFTGVWANVYGSVVTAETAPSGSYSDALAAKSTGYTNGIPVYYSRPFGSVSTGTFVWQQRTTSNALGNQIVGLLDTNANFLSTVVFESDGHIHACPFFASDTDLGAYSANHWYLVYAQYDLAGHPGQFRVSLDKGSYSSWINVCSGTGSVYKIAMYDDLASTTAHSFWLDTIGAQSTALYYSSQPSSSVTSGASFSTTVAVVYSDGTTTNDSAANSVTIGVCSGSPSVVLGGTLTQSASSGLATFANLTLTQTSGASGVTLCSTASGLTSATSTAITVVGATPPAITVKPRIRIGIK